MHTCHLSQIVILPNRQRQEFDAQALQELRDSIEFDEDDKSKQLQHAPVLRESDGKLILVAGERRLKALKSIFDLGGKLLYNGQIFEDGQVPYSLLGDLSVLEAEEAELSENLNRRDLSWQELAETHARLHKLRGQQKMQLVVDKMDSGEIPFGENIEPVPHTIAETAREVHGRADGWYQDNIRKEVIVAKHLNNPAVAAAKTLDEAVKILKKEEDKARNIALGLGVGKTFNADIHEIFNENCLGWMARMPADQFDVICTDPPYGMGAHEFGDAGGKMTGIEHHYDDSYESWQLLMAGFQIGETGVYEKGWCELAYRAAKPQAHAYVFCDFDRFHELKGYMESAGWYVFRTPFVIVKKNSGRVPRPQHGPRRQYELCLYAIKGDKTVNHIYPDVIEVEADDNTGHGAQKPVALFVNLLQRSVKPGDVVLDSFGGSGPLLPAAHALQCKAVVIEQNPEYYAKCVRRAQDLKKLEAPGNNQF